MSSTLDERYFHMRAAYEGAVVAETARGKAYEDARYYVVAIMVRLKTQQDLFDVLTAIETGNSAALSIEDDNEVSKSRVDPFTCTTFRCGRCGKSKTAYFEVQTRASDEPATLFVTCGPCVETHALAYRHGYTYSVPRDPRSLELRGEQWGIDLLPLTGTSTVFHQVSEVIPVYLANERIRDEGVRFALLDRASCNGKEAIVVTVNIVSRVDPPHFYVCEFVATGTREIVWPWKVAEWRSNDDT